MSQEIVFSKKKQMLDLFGRQSQPNKLGPPKTGALGTSVDLTHTNEPKKSKKGINNLARDIDEGAYMNHT